MLFLPSSHPSLPIVPCRYVALFIHFFRFETAYKRVRCERIRVIGIRINIILFYLVRSESILNN